MFSDRDRDFEDEFDPVLWNIEAEIVSVWDAEPDLLDLEVADALGALLRHYAAEQNGQRSPGLRLTPRATAVFECVRLVCDWQLGREPTQASTAAEPPAVETPVSLPDILRSLKRVQKSVRLWNEASGRQGYLTFVKKYVSEDEARFEVYDPEADPVPDEWLEKDESERIEAIVAYHSREAPDLPNAELHAMIHLVVENQLALGEKPVVEALERLRKEGLSRHDALHAIGGRLAEQMWALLGEKASYRDAGLYLAQLATLNAREWRGRSGGK